MKQKGLRGYVKVELCNPRSGSTVKVLGEGYNIITNLYSEFINKVVLSLMSPYSNGIPYKYMQITPQQLSNGILLLESPQNISTTTLNPKGKITGYAGSEYNGENLERGSVNHSLTGEIPGEGYQWTYEWQTERGNGLISAVGLTPQSVGDGNFITNDWGFGRIQMFDNLVLYSVENTPVFDNVDDEGNWYSYSTSIQSYVKGQKAPSPYLTQYRDSWILADCFLHLDETPLHTGRPVLYKDHLWMRASKVDGNGEYLLKINKGTGNIVQYWELPSYELNPLREAIGITDKYMMFVPSSQGDRVKCFNLITGEYESVTPMLSYNNYGASNRPVVWYCTEDWACVMGSSSSSTSSPSKSDTHANIIYNDLSVKNLNSIATEQLTYRSLIRFGNSPFGATYADRGVIRHFGGMLPLFSVRNLENPVEKDNTKTLKVTYKLLYS